MIDFFEFSNEMLCLANQQGYLTRVNPAWTKTLGWSAEELTSRPYVEFVHPDDLDATIREAQLLLSGKHETVWFENRYRCRDGSYRWLAWKVTVIPSIGQEICSARDITEQKLQALALAESEERFRLLATRAPIGIAQADAEGAIFFANSKWCEMAGVTAAEAIGVAWKKFIHPEDLTRVLSHWQSSLRAGQDMPPVEFRFLHRNGDIRWASSSSTLLKDAAGKITGQIVSQQDITERKEAENALRESEERFRALVTKAPVVVYQSDESGQLSFISQRWSELTGLTIEESLGIGWGRAIHPDDVGHLNEKWAAATAAHEEYENEFRIVHQDGSIRWLATSAAAIRNSQGQVIGNIGISIDVTDRKAAEEARRESEERFQAFMSHSPALAWVKDEQGRYVYLNKAYENRFQIRLADWLGKTDFEVWPQEVARKFWENDRKVLADNENLQTVEESINDDRERNYWLTSKFVFRNSRNDRLIGGVGVDVTSLKQSEQALRTERELLRNLIEVQEKEKQFLCHEFHDGLIQYAFGSTMLLESCLSNPQSADNGSKIKTAIVNLRRGVEDGRRVIRGVRPAVLDDSGLEAAMEDLVGQFENSGMHVTGKCDPGIGRLPESIQTTVYRVVQEALNNAKKYSGTDVVRIELKKADGNLYLEVRDFGCGFDVESARKKGFGLLGMTERVRLLGGECLIESKSDVGTTISVRLPIPTTNDEK